MGAVTHIAGLYVTVEDRYLRQRCAWCGAVLHDYDLANMAEQIDFADLHHSAEPSMWPVGAMVRVDGNVSMVVAEQGQEAKLPDDACAMLDPAATL
jgi:hypothetical protein